MSRNPPTESVRIVDLDHEQLLVLCNRNGARIRVLSGGTWLTEEGRLDDVHVQRGDTVTITTPGRAVIEGMGRSRVEVALPQPLAWTGRLVQAVNAWRNKSWQPARARLRPRPAP
jgi:hypothetical protein